MLITPPWEPDDPPYRPFEFNPVIDSAYRDSLDRLVNATSPDGEAQRIQQRASALRDRPPHKSESAIGELRARLTQYLSLINRRLPERRAFQALYVRATTAISFFTLFGWLFYGTTASAGELAPYVPLALSRDREQLARANDSTSQGINKVEVFYATDRKAFHVDHPNELQRNSWIATGLILFMAFLYFQFFKITSRFGRFKKHVTYGLLAIICLCFLLGIGYHNFLPSYTRNTLRFANERDPDGKMHYGTSLVSVPKNHKRGKLESPSLLAFELNSNPDEHFTVLKLDDNKDAAEHFKELRRRLNAGIQINESSSVRDHHPDSIILFVHGYNVNFDDAARRAAQLTCDLTFKGMTCIYSWPSCNNFLAYMVDGNNSELGRIRFHEYLKGIANEVKPRNIILVAHSMGCRCLHGCLLDLEKEGLLDTVRHVVYAAPDVDAELFATTIDQVTKKGTDVTLYASSNDRALWASKFFVNRNWRAGDSTNGIIVRPPMQSIDASEVETDFLGHSYYGDHESVVHDIGEVIRGRKLSQGRLKFLDEVSKGTSKYLKINPKKKN